LCVIFTRPGWTPNRLAHTDSRSEPPTRLITEVTRVLSKLPVAYHNVQ
jgi:hypothetical protein